MFGTKIPSRLEERAVQRQILIVGLFLGLGWFFMRSTYALGLLLDDDQKKFISEFMVKAKPLPSNVENALLKSDPGLLGRGVLKYHFITGLLNIPLEISPCNEIGYLYLYNPGSPSFGNQKINFISRIEELSLEYYIQRKYGIKSCLAAALAKGDFGLGVTGIENASRFYFKKNWENLSEREVYILFQIYLTPANYRKYLNAPNSVKN
jgi:hypothetical protein